MRRTFRADDQLGRLGGDEFCVFMPVKAGMSDEERNFLINRKCTELCSAFAFHDYGLDTNFKASVSVGVSVYPQNGATFGALYKAADGALYISKRKGKNTFTICGEEAE